jgi:hypothetical protein
LWPTPAVWRRCDCILGRPDERFQVSFFRPVWGLSIA